MAWAVGFGALFLLLGGGAVAAALAGYGQAVLIVGVTLVIMIPISTVILIVSMILSSYIAGGIEFGEIHVVIPKAMGLLVIVNLVTLIPVGGYILAFPVWLFGLMYLFSLDIWESRFLIVINWFLNTVAKWFIVGLLIAVFSHAGKDGSDSSLDDFRPQALGAKDADGLCEQLLQHADSVELGGWLKGGNQRVVLNHSHAESVSLAQQLTGWGARRVTAVNQMKIGAAETVSILVVELPRDAPARKQLVAWRNQQAAESGDAPTADEGQKFLLVTFE